MHGRCKKEQTDRGGGGTYLYGGGGGRLNHPGLGGGGQADGLRSLKAMWREKRSYVMTKHHGKYG